MTAYGIPKEGKVIPAPTTLERTLFPKDRRLRLVRIDDDDYHGWYLREVPDEEPLLFLDDGRGPLLYNMLEQAIQHLRQRQLDINIDNLDGHR